MKILNLKVNGLLLIIITCVFLCIQFFNRCTVGNEPSDYKGNFNIYYLQDQEIVFGDLVGKDLSTFKIQDKPWISDKDIEYYDFSSHCIYLKKDKSVAFPEYKTFYTNISWNYKPFIVVAKDKICYAGYFEGNGSMKYNVPKINGITVYFYPKDIIALEVNNYLFAKDMRNNEQVKNALIESNIYRGGISVEIDDIKIYSAAISTIEYTIIIKNNDSDNLYVIDPDKTGSGLFHYYNNGIILLDINTQDSYWSEYKTIIEPESFSYFDIKWFTKLEPGQSIKRTIILKGYKYIPYNNYYCQMLFDSPNTIEKEQRTQKDGMIWIGPTTTNALDITYDKDNNCRINNRNVILE